MKQFPTLFLHTARQLLLLCLLGAPACVIWLPLWWLLIGAFTNNAALLADFGAALSLREGFAQARLLPLFPTPQPLVQLALDTPEFFVMFWNSTAQVFAQLAGQLIVGAPAAWALSRLRFRGRHALFLLYIILMLLPFQVTMVPSYLVLDTLALTDTVWAVILPGAFAAFPVFLMTKGFDAVPYALLEAAALDGANHWQRFARIGLPLGMPGIVSALVLGFFEAWSAVEQPMTFLQTRALWPLSLYLPTVQADALALSMAAGLVALLPAVAMFRFGQKYLELGIQSSGLKE